MLTCTALHCIQDREFIVVGMTQNGEGQQVIQVIWNMGYRKGGLGDEVGLEG